MLFVNRCQIGALQYMEKLQLDTLDILCSQIAYSLQHLFTVFAWKSQNDMDNGLQIPCPEPCHSIGEGGEGVAAADEGGGILVNGLQPQLNPDRLFPV